MIGAIAIATVIVFIIDPMWNAIFPKRKRR